MSDHNHYPSFDIMEGFTEWDKHTQSIIKTRMHREHALSSLTAIEAENLRAWCSLLMDDHRGEVIQFIIHHIDHKLTDHRGEGYQLVGMPGLREFISRGLKAIDETGWYQNSQPFFQLREDMQRNIMLQIHDGSYPTTKNWEGISQKLLFDKLHQLSIEAYYAHPLIWSEIGFGGPAYPRGYSLQEPDQLETWEAVKRS
ncbi:gluconate 2-dehydrogenase subunit 3 family protein [Paenibacillus roseipurpureus]|uniref:Gluconate 2-dehydrogenase subunit 3 family protein n=1 Tax=Paenibacillus roseopurpureus TaxID=2918901 RepID=A0AA96LMN5_9BACL|nr:gluconate 2-dehydrogenase subunit 3 family protein [Paenibacillus sp. MBLB1832]WNR44807.1 gluconate 2-dehydrogenase subunit 3 family protein [Paenibacillus sp. MBLB1832]